MEGKIQEGLDDVQHITFHNAQSRVGLVIYNVLQQEMLDLSRKQVIEEMLGVHTVKSSDTNEAAEGLSKSLLTSTSFIAPIATFVLLKTDLAMEGQKYIAAVGAVEPEDTIQMFDDASDLPQDG